MSSSKIPGDREERQGGVRFPLQDDVDNISYHTTLLNEHESDLSGLRELILDNAILIFPHLVHKHRKDNQYSLRADALKVSVVPIYPNDSSLSKERSDFANCGYRAFLEHKETPQTEHHHVAGGAIRLNIAAALQSLLINLRAMLTAKDAEVEQMSRNENENLISPFGERCGYVDGAELERARLFIRRGEEHQSLHKQSIKEEFNEKTRNRSRSRSRANEGRGTRVELESGNQRTGGPYDRVSDQHVG